MDRVQAGSKHEAPTKRRGALWRATRAKEGAWTSKQAPCFEPERRVHSALGDLLARELVGPQRGLAVAGAVDLEAEGGDGELELLRG